ncbi:MAG: PTS sugar transporter subunit IIA [Phycisphaerae bacterium]|jgi:mannitol/fructose-specific phosphotransferase system IIA component (Ntr-type)|nr:PTS sugar transporter subunit IIA [Phycisphaerae bacterium]
MKLSEVITIDLIKVPLTAEDKFAAIEELVDVVGSAKLVGDIESLRRAVLDRETTRSTGIGHGLAIPHGKSPGVHRLIAAVGKPKIPIDFESVDHKPVNLIVLLASPMDQTGPHIQALARISRFMLSPSFCSQIDRAMTAEEVYQAFLDHEK